MSIQTNYYQSPKKAKKHQKNPSNSFLLQLSRQVQWATNFNLHPFSGHNLRDLYTSQETNKLIAKYNQTVHELKLSIKEDYKKQKADILYNRKITTSNLRVK